VLASGFLSLFDGAEFKDATRVLLRSDGPPARECRRKLSKSPRRIGALFISSIERNFCTRLFGFIVANQSVRVALLHPYDPSRERYLSSFDRVKLVFQLVNLVSDPVKQEIIAHGLPNSAAHDGDEQWQSL
jgi:hypothetical protein